MIYVDSLNILGVDAKQIPCIKGSGAPTTTTAAEVGMFYMDTSTGDVYKCTAVSGSTYTWVDLALKVAQTTGDSETDVMSQKATTDAIDLLATSQKICVFGGDFSGNNYGEFKCSIPAGTYNLHIDSVETSDTDATTSVILFVSNGATIKSRSLARNTPIDGEIVFSSSVDVIRIYASTDWSSGQGDTFSVNGLKIIEDTVLNKRTTDLEDAIGAVTTRINNKLLRPVNADTIPWTKRTVYNGEYQNDYFAISTNQFFMGAGSTINFDSLDGKYHFRVTEFNLDKSYKKNTGAMSAIGSYQIDEDCYIAITMKEANNTSNPSDLSMGNSARVMFDGYVEVDYDNLDKISKMLEYNTMKPVDADTVNWSQTSIFNGAYNADPYCISCDQFLALAGSTITFSGKYTVRITVFDLNKQYVSNTGAYVAMDSYKVESDCYIGIGLRDANGAPPISEGNSTNVAFEGFIATDDEVINKVTSDIRKNTFNNVYSDIEDVFATALSTFAGHTDSTGVVEPFVFFTDPHPFIANNYSLGTYMSIMSNIQRLYNNSSANFLVCGGDWFSYARAREELCVKLGYIKGSLQNMFKNAYTAVGNHDLALDGTTSGEWFLNTQSLANALYGGRKCYYSFEGANTKCYVLDTGYDHDLVMSDYRWEQIDWLAERFKTEDAEHSLMFMHIYAYHEDALAGNPVTTEHIHPFARNIVDLVSAYNSKSTVTLNGKEYDFSTCSGKMHCLICGHTHHDFNLVDNNVPIVGTLTAQTMVNGVPSFDMCVADYGSNKLYLTRIGYGSNRVIDLA